MNTAIFELEDKAARKLLGSQREFLFAPEPFSVLAGGYGSGKTHVSCIKGLILSAMIPGNRGIVGRFHSTDLEDTTMPTFFEVCPQSWIRNWDKQRKVLTLKNYSQVLFRHIHDPNARGGVKSRRVGANLGWGFIDQLEECDIEHWNMLMGRLRLPRAKKRFLFGTANPNGHDWIWKLFFQNYHPFAPDELFQVCRRGTRLGIAVRSDENKRSNGGFVDDDYVDNMRANYPADWVARYVDCSFDEFTGKVFKEFGLQTVHNIDPFPVPAYWPHIVSIDVGGSHPWAVLDNVLDDHGNMITVKELHRPGMTSLQVANWIKENTPWNGNNTIFVIDWENKVVSIELAEYDIHCRPADKHVSAGLIRLQGYIHLNKHRTAPDWFKESQPASAVEKAEKFGFPKYLVSKICVNTRSSFDGYVYDEKSGKPKDKDDDPVDSARYAVMSRPEAANPAIAEQMALDAARANLKTRDPASAREWESIERKRQDRTRRQKGLPDYREFGEETCEPMSARRGYDWGGGE